MRRLFWLVTGITVGILVFRKLQQTAEKMSATSVGKSIGGALSELAQTIGEFAADVRVAMQEQEAALREGAGLDADTGGADTESSSRS